MARSSGVNSRLKRDPFSGLVTFLLRFDAVLGELCLQGFAGFRALAEVTDEFLAYLQALYAEGTERALDEASEFLVTAATLLELKTARLLPQHREPLEEDVALLEARDLLFARLLQYRAYREVAEIFAERWAQEARRFPRAVALEERFAHALPELVLTGGAEEFARIAAAALSRQPAESEPAAEEIVEELNEHLHVPVTTIAAEEHYLLHTLLDASGRELRFDELVRGAGDLEIAVVRFLALLELYKEGATSVISSLRREIRVNRRSKGPSKLLRVRVKPRSGFCGPRPSGRAFWAASAFGVGTLTAATYVVIKTCSPYVFSVPRSARCIRSMPPGVPAGIVRLAPSAISRRRLQPSNGKVVGAGGNESP